MRNWEERRREKHGDRWGEERGRGADVGCSPQSSNFIPGPFVTGRSGASTTQGLEFGPFSFFLFFFHSLPYIFPSLSSLPSSDLIPISAIVDLFFPLLPSIRPSLLLPAPPSLSPLSYLPFFLTGSIISSSSFFSSSYLSFLPSFFLKLYVSETNPQSLVIQHSFSSHTDHAF